MRSRLAWRREEEARNEIADGGDRGRQGYVQKKDRRRVVGSGQRAGGRRGGGGCGEGSRKGTRGKDLAVKRGYILRVGGGKKRDAMRGNNAGKKRSNKVDSGKQPAPSNVRAGLK